MCMYMYMYMYPHDTFPRVAPRNVSTALHIRGANGAYSVLYNPGIHDPNVWDTIGAFGATQEHSAPPNNEVCGKISCMRFSESYKAGTEHARARTSAQ
jgi:hypothetical protein